MANAAPQRLTLNLSSSMFGQTASLRLNRILRAHPGHDGVVLVVHQSDGRTFRAELPLQVDSRNTIMLSELYDLFGAPVWMAS